MIRANVKRRQRGRDQTKLRIKLRPATRAEKLLIRRWLVQRLAEQIVEATSKSLE